MRILFSFERDQCGVCDTVQHTAVTSAKLHQGVVDCAIAQKLFDDGCTLLGVNPDIEAPQRLSNGLTEVVATDAFKALVRFHHDTVAEPGDDDPVRTGVKHAGEFFLGRRQLGDVGGDQADSDNFLVSATQREFGGFQLAPLALALHHRPIGHLFATLQYLEIAGAKDACGFRRVNIHIPLADDLLPGKTKLPLVLAVDHLVAAIRILDADHQRRVVDRCLKQGLLMLQVLASLV